MKTPWINSSTALPSDGQPIEFVLDHREVAIAGTYAGQIFRSRWSSYDIERVAAWRLAAFSSSSHAQGAEGCAASEMRVIPVQDHGHGAGALSAR
jgi:hypothetical protein